MKTLFHALVCFLFFTGIQAQQNNIDHSNIQEDLEQILNDIEKYYVYFPEKNVDLKCIKSYYSNQISNLKTQDEVVLFFEYLLNEFYDSHVILNTNRNSSYRLYSPIYISLRDGKPVVSSIWVSQLESLQPNIFEAELLKINGKSVAHAIAEFPTQCPDKNDSVVREWIIKRLIAGRYNEPRILTLKLSNNSIVDFDLDNLVYKQRQELVSAERINDIGVIRINNSLGTNDLIAAFDKTLDDMMSTKGLIIDLRNTVDGGNSYVARGIMGRFLEKEMPYQKHEYTELYDGVSPVKRSWVEYVSPREEIYTKPVVVLVGRWTGSMGEGVAIGFDGMNRATIVGTEMERLAGEMSFVQFKNQRFGYRISTAKLFHLNGLAREKFVPGNYVQQSTTDKDEILEKGIEVLEKFY